MAVLLGYKEGKEVYASWPVGCALGEATSTGEDGNATPDRTQIKSIDPKRQIIEVVASDETVDRDREVIRAEGWILATYKKNLVVLFAHDHRSLPIARSDQVWVDKDRKQLRAVIRFATADTGNGLGEAVFKLYENGFLNSVSVGFIPVEILRHDEGAELDPAGTKPPARIRREFVKQELLEISAVAVPSNPNARVTAAHRDSSLAFGEDVLKELEWMKSKGLLGGNRRPDE